jgi:C1A family cysteine protease
MKIIYIIMSQTINIVTLLALAGVISYFFFNGVVPVGVVPVQQSDFELFKQTHGIKFDSIFENNYRESVYLANVAKINAHNKNEFRTYDMGVNQFTHLNTEEFSEIYLRTIVPQSKIIVDETDTILGDVDWTTAGVVTGVKDQGQCGSCWAFSATGSLESLSKIAYGTLQSFSEQQLVDCSDLYGNQGCNGGLMDNAFKYVRDHGITTEAAYPYKAVKGTCTTR